jgi:CheY-like chemotaxis protein
VAGIRRELGEILLEADLVSPEQLNEALALQKAYGERLASILVRKRILTEKFAVTYLGRQVGVPGVDLSKADIDLGLLDLIPLELCERHLVFPVQIEGTYLQLAMVDPTDSVLVAQIENETGVRLAPMIALESSIKNAVREGRRAVRNGQRTISPNIQRPLVEPEPSVPPPAAAPVPYPALPPEEPSPVGAAAEAPAEALPEAPYLPTRPMTLSEEKARALFETLAGGELDIAQPREVTPPPVPTGEETQTVLVAEDDAATRAHLESLLRGRRYRVLAVRSGREALTMVRERMPDLVLIDGLLPEVHGFEICHQLKSSDRFRHIPVVLMAPVGLGWRFAADARERYGAEELIERPYDPDDLLRRVDLLLNRVPAGLAPDSEATVRKHLKDGVVALKQNRLEDAVESLARGLAVDQYNDMLHYYLGMAYDKLNSPFHAIDHYERAVQLNQDFYDAIVSLANIYQRQEFRRKAVEMWELALQTTKDEGVRARIKEHVISLL